MVARLGNVLYWLGCIIAAASTFLAVFVILSWDLKPPPNGIVWIVIYLAAGFASWLAGRAARYVLAGT